MPLALAEAFDIPVLLFALMFAKSAIKLSKLVIFESDPPVGNFVFIFTCLIRIITWNRESILPETKDLEVLHYN
jgi:hypothetical protein